MSLKKIAQNILKSGTVGGTVSGTGCPNIPKNKKPSGTASTLMVKPNYESVPLSRPYMRGTVGQQAKSGTVGGTVSGTVENLQYLLQRVGAYIRNDIDGTALVFDPPLAGTQHDAVRWSQAEELEKIFLQEVK